MQNLNLITNLHVETLRTSETGIYGIHAVTMT